MAKQLKRYVTLRNPNTGRAETFGPGDELPGWARKRVSNKAVFDEPGRRSGARVQAARQSQFGKPLAKRVEEAEQEEGDEYDDWSNDKLKAELKDRDLPQSGNKKELINRLRAADEGQFDTPEPPEEEDEDEDEEEDTDSEEDSEDSDEEEEDDEEDED